MKNQSRQLSEIIFKNYRLLLLCVLLPFSTTCFADEGASATGAANEVQPFDDIGMQNDGKMKVKPTVEELGKEKYRIGSIQVDKAKRLITVPGVMLPHEEGKAIEFMATMKQGYKSYESVISLDANAFEFNLACILIGLDAKKAVPPKFHFDPQPVQGDPVSIKVSWKKNGKQVEYDVLELLKAGETKAEIPSVWSYTGSAFDDHDRYMAQMDGVLIGVIHDPASIIEHKKGLGVGQWGSLMVNPDIAPQGGHEVVVSIQSLD